jgi:predicted transcriptional regulator
MLEHLFGSKTRAKLLTVFVHHPEQAFFVRELTRAIDTQINAVRRELENLVELGLVVEAVASTDEGKRPGLKRKYYKMNETFPLLGEIRTLITKAHVLMERRLDREISALGDIQYLALLGAFIGKQGAPVDVFIIGETDEKALAKLMQRLEKELGFEINFTCMTVPDFKYRKEITDRFLYSILESPKNVMVNKLDIS